MPEINKITSGPLAKSAKLNEVIAVLNAIGFNLTVRAGTGDETPQLIVADNNAVLIVTSGAGAGGGGGGGDTIDVIWCVNGELFDGTAVGTIGDPI